MTDLARPAARLPVFVLLKKDLLLQWRERAQSVAILAFGGAALLLFSFAVGPDAQALRQQAAGFLWLGLLLASTLSLAESFEREMEDRALEGVLLLPASPRAIFYAKALANWIRLALVGVALVPALVGVILLGTAALSAPGTLYSAMTVQARARQTLLPLLLFPLVVPVLIAAVRATSLVILGDPMQQLQPWVRMLAVFDLIYWSLCGLLFGRVVED